MGTATLSWFADRGFELTTEVADDEVSLRFEAVPVPADGFGEMREGVKLNKLDVLFKAVVEVGGGRLAQVLEASVQLVQRDGSTALVLDTECEDVETGQAVPFKAELPVVLPEGAPEAGGPRPESMTEDDLDFEDDTTLEKVLGSGPEPAAPSPSGGAADDDEPKGSRGLQRLLAAIVGDPADSPQERGKVQEGGNEAEIEAPREPGDQSMSAADEARGLLEHLVRAEYLELEEGAEVEALVAGTVPILASRQSSEAKASNLGSWLLEQDSVADLYIGDEDLAAILDQW